MRITFWWFLFFYFCSYAEGTRTPRGQLALRKRLTIVFSDVGVQTGTGMRSIWVVKQGIRLADATLMAHHKE